MPGAVTSGLMMSSATGLGPRICPPAERLRVRLVDVIGGAPHVVVDHDTGEGVPYLDPELVDPAAAQSVAVRGGKQAAEAGLPINTPAPFGLGLGARDDEPLIELARPLRAGRDRYPPAETYVF
jgi:hypothetical protein